MEPFQWGLALRDTQNVYRKHVGKLVRGTRKRPAKLLRTIS